jgi:hypothetical protein
MCTCLRARTLSGCAHEHMSGLLWLALCCSGWWQRFDGAPLHCQGFASLHLTSQLHPVYVLVAGACCVRLAACPLNALCRVWLGCAEAAWRSVCLFFLPARHMISLCTTWGRLLCCAPFFVLAACIAALKCCEHLWQGVACRPSCMHLLFTHWVMHPPARGCGAGCCLWIAYPTTCGSVHVVLLVCFMFVCITHVLGVSQGATQ